MHRMPHPELYKEGLKNNVVCIFMYFFYSRWQSPLRAPKSVHLLMPLPEVKFPLGKGMTLRKNLYKQLLKVMASMIYGT